MSWEVFWEKALEVWKKVLETTTALARSKQEVKEVQEDVKFTKFVKNINMQKEVLKKTLESKKKLTDDDKQRLKRYWKWNTTFQIEEDKVSKTVTLTNYGKKTTLCLDWENIYLKDQFNQNNKSLSFPLSLWWQNWVAEYEALRIANIINFSESELDANSYYRKWLELFLDNAKKRNDKESVVKLKKDYLEELKKDWNLNPYNPIWMTSGEMRYVGVNSNITLLRFVNNVIGFWVDINHPSYDKIVYKQNF